MLNIKDIVNHSFVPQRGGNYKSSEVDEFFSQVKETVLALSSSYEKMKNYSDEQARKNAELSEQIEMHKSNAESVASALIIAQKSADNILSTAKAEAERITSDAQKTAETTINSIKGETDAYVRDHKAEADAYLEKAKREYSKAIQDANVKSEEIVNGANNQAKSILDDVQDKANEIIAKANMESDKITSDSSVKVTEANALLQHLKKVVEQFTSSSIGILNQQIALLSSVDVDDDRYKVNADLSKYLLDSSIISEPEFKPEQADKIYATAVEKLPEETDEEVKDEDEEEITEPEDETPEETEEIDEEEILIEEYSEEEVDTDSEDEIKEDDFDDITSFSEEKKQEEEQIQEQEETVEPEKETSDFDIESIFTNPVNEKKSSDSDDDEEDLAFGPGYDIFGDDDDQSSFFSKFKRN